MIFVRSFLIDISLWSMRLLSNHEQRTLSCSTLSISYISQSNFRSSAESHQQKHFTTLNDGPKNLFHPLCVNWNQRHVFPCLRLTASLNWTPLFWLAVVIYLFICTLLNWECSYDWESGCNSVPLPKYSIILKKFGNYLSFYSVNLTKCKISLPSGSWQKSEKKKTWNIESESKQ